jgi:ubiquinone/menaquinone biosynthesis C-methylase UbiE
VGPRDKVRKVSKARKVRQGHEGWDAYAPFYDWENARTLGRRDVPFWSRVAKHADGAVLELGCGTGRVSVPLARAGVDLVGIDRSAPMLARAIARLKPRATATPRLKLVRGDIRALPFPSGSFSMVLAPYGILQSLTRDRDLVDALASAARVLQPGGLLGIDLVPDVPNWREYANRVQLRGRVRGARLTLVESVRQDRRRRLTTFDQRYIVRRSGKPEQQHRFALTFRTLTVKQMSRRLERAGFTVESVLGDYRGRPWDERAEVWIILARKRHGRPE